MSTTHPHTPLIEAAMIYVCRGDSLIIEAQSVRIQKGLTLLTGENGAGKSTLAAALHGLIPIENGVVQHNFGEAPAGWQQIGNRHLSRRERRSAARSVSSHRSRYMGYIAQTPAIVPGISARDYVLGSHAIRGNRVSEERVDGIFDELGISAHSGKSHGQLSKGEEQKAAFALAFAHNPDFVTADEPTASLDAGASVKAMEFLRRQVDDFGATILMVTHDPVAVDYADSTIHMADGRIESID